MLMMAMLGAIGMSFGFIKMRQRSVQSEMMAINMRMNKAQEQIAQLEQLKVKGQTMLKTMVMTSELIEPVPRSIILASLTNSMPVGVSLLDFNLKENEVKVSTSSTRTAAKPGAKPGAKPANQYQAKSAKAAAPAEPERKVDTRLEWMGIAPSDIEGASYIARLSSSLLV